MGSVTLADVLKQADTDDVVGKLKVLSLLESLPGVGKVKARRLMEEIGISDSRRVQGLGAHQRQSLLDHLGGAS
jgi:ribosomal protein S13